MHVQPKLGRSDRIGSALFGLALVAIGLFWEFDRPGTPVFAIALGVVFVAGGLLGTAPLRGLLGLASRGA